MKNNYSLYFSHTSTTILVILLEDKAYLSSKEFPKNKIDSFLIESIQTLLKESDICIDNIHSFYLSNINSNWNANRLLFLFVKVCATFKEKEVFLQEQKSINFFEDNNIQKEIKNINKNLQSFHKIENIETFNPIYN